MESSRSRELPAEYLASYLAGIELPASKLEVIAIAEANGAPHEVLESLQRMKTERVESVAEVETAVRTPGA